MVLLRKYFIQNFFVWQGFLVALFIIGGCSTANKEMLPPKITLRPPNAANWPLSRNLSGAVFRTKDIQAAEDYLNRIEKEDSKKTTIWWTQYKKAQIWQAKKPAVSCQIYKKLSHDPEFPIRKVAELRAYETCSGDLAKDMADFSGLQYEEWLELPVLDVSIVKAKRDGNKTLLADLYLKKSKLPIRKEDKIEFTKDALHLARSHKTPADVTALEQRLYSLSPSLNPKPDIKDAMSLASDFRFYRNFTKAREYYAAVIKSRHFSVADKISAYRGIRSTYRLQLNREEAVRATEKMVKFVENYYKKKKRKDLKTIADVKMILARDYWTEQQVTQAERTLESLLRQLPAGPSLAEAFWILGRMAEEKQDFANAVIQYEKALAQPGITKEFKKRANWYYSWNLRKQKDFAKAIDILKALKDDSDSSYDYARYAYWLAYTYREKGDADEAKSEFKSLIDKEPLSFYGLVAHRDLDIELPVKEIKREIATEKNIEKIAEQKEIRQTSTRLVRSMTDELFVEWLIAVNENEITREYLNDVAGQLRKSKSAGTDDWAALFQYFARAGEYLNLFSQMGALSVEDRKTLLDQHPELMFPQPYYETVAKAATRFGISTEYIYSIMRQESSFNPQARSQMDAFGLMQLLPEVAKKSAEANTLEYSRPEDLYEPEVNIPLGAAHLKELWDRYDGEIILATASYNASEKAIHNWIKTRYRPKIAGPTASPTLEFIEDIPYDETRDYVKLVLRNLVTYQMLTATSRPVMFPDWTLRITAKR